jgi:hypothetical protein
MLEQGASVFHIQHIKYFLTYQGGFQMSTKRVIDEEYRAKEPCIYCGNPDLEIEDSWCDDCEEEQGEILRSEEARGYGVPYKLQIWSEVAPSKEYDDVEVKYIDYATVGFISKTHKHKGHHHLSREEFMQRFRFKDTLY